MTKFPRHKGQLKKTRSQKALAEEATLRKHTPNLHPRCPSSSHRFTTNSDFLSSFKQRQSPRPCKPLSLDTCSRSVHPHDIRMPATNWCARYSSISHPISSAHLEALLHTLSYYVWSYITRQPNRDHMHRDATTSHSLSCTHIIKPLKSAPKSTLSHRTGA
ncbi:hypothetical protein TVAGG3_0564430 [Trichomonas vaginalis G3]|uniref:hypothetical protein n=1 Tax=Trichomonas vaginalis (strain ATCC PRA-98 / G3) TaxID=412133 RepID=UPI0021E59B9F|nr:hypothetical protein TVAGG3_0564430 [Trichomonas vaginalis G3]KAI5521458.1 hypothetical protein TVAGG3_0564430 [Trichomonas vaginalis G3]